MGRLARNAGILLAGNLLAAVCGLVCHVLAARTLGPERYGILALIITYGLVINGLASFQSWKALVRYGARCLERGRREDFRSLMKFGLVLDLGGSFLGTVTGVAGVVILGRIRGWDQETVFLAALYSGSILFHSCGTPLAVLRLFDRFDLNAAQLAGAAMVRMGAVIALAVSRAGLRAFVWAWFLTEIFGYLLTILWGWREYRRRRFGSVLRAPLQGIPAKFTGIWRFVWSTNFQFSLKLGVKELDVLVVGGLLGPAAAGVYKIAKQFTRIMDRFTDPLNQSVYPALAKSWVRKDYSGFRKLMIRPALALAVVGVLVWTVFLAAGPRILILTVGGRYAGAYFPILVLMAGMLVAAATFPLEPALLAMGRADESFQAFAWASLLYFGLLAVLTKAWGITGATLSSLGFYSIWALLLARKIRGRLKQPA